MAVHINITDEALHDILQLLLDQYGYDFTEYSQTSLKRRVIRFMDISQITTAEELIYQLHTKKTLFHKLLQTVTVNVTEMFRDPTFYKILREKILPELATYPIIKIWHAGCATGEEVFSLAILLSEENLLNRCRIYATDINPENIDKARKGIITVANMKEYTQNYYKSGGRKDFSSYYTARYDHVLISRELRKDIIFAQHNLVTDTVFNEFQLILCRNVLIYFNESLQKKVINLFYDSLSPLGYFAIGMKESLFFKDLNNLFDSAIPAHKIFKKRN